MSTLQKIFLLLLGLCTAAGAAAQNYLANPGFETQGKWQLTTSNGGSFMILSDASMAKSGKGYGELKTAAGKSQARCTQILTLPQLWGKSFRFSVYAKGNGEIILGAITYPSKSDKYQWQKKATPLSAEYQQIVFDFSIDDPAALKLNLAIEIRGEGSVAQLDDTLLTAIFKPGAELKAVPSHLVIPEGAEVPPITFEFTRDGKKVDNAVISTAQTNDKELAAVKDAGVSVEVFIDKAPVDQFEKLDAAAANIKLSKPLHILYLGDSLTDFERGHNYTDKVNYFLNKYNPGKASFRNAGVGGDFITRMLDRLNGMNGGKPAHRQVMYNQLWAEKYDLICILLGHNDTKLNAAQQPYVTPEAQEQGYRKVIEIIRANSDAPILLISPTSSVYEIGLARREKNPKASLFGNPEEMEKFDAMLRRISPELKLGYLNIYTKTRDYQPAKNALFCSDGVHLTEEGNRFIAQLVLEHFAKGQ